MCKNPEDILMFVISIITDASKPAVEFILQHKDTLWY